MNTSDYKRKEYRVNNIELCLDYNTDNVIISTEVDYIDYMKTFEEEEIKEMHFLFYSDVKYFFEMELICITLEVTFGGGVKAPAFMLKRTLASA